MVLAFAAVADAQGPVFHERFAPDPAEDLALGARVASGTLPAVLQTRSGLVEAPDAAFESLRQGDVYGGPAAADQGSTFLLDRLTSRPERVRYDSPFRPSVIPFKRLYAFDRVDASFSLGVSDESLRPVPLGGEAEAGEDVFFADIEVDVLAGEPARIPHVAAGSRLLLLDTEPKRQLEVLRDGADNWFVRAAESGRVRLLMELSADRRAFGETYPPISWTDLRPFRPSIPPAVRAVADQVAEHIGVSQTESPSHALHLLVDYFRRFRDSDELPRASNQAELYRELSFGQKGVCRHRAYAFLVTAQAVGLPTRLVHNEAHAWVEVFNAERWTRIDLGGAAAQVERPLDNRPSINHKPPPDPFSWPRGAERGELLSQAAAQASGQARSNGEEAAETAPHGARPGEPDVAAGPADDASPAPRSGGMGSLARRGLRSLLGLTQPDPPASKVQISLEVRGDEVTRGAPITVSGRAMRQGRPCAMARLDVLLGSSQRVVGSVATGREGYFLGQVSVPADTPVGDQSLDIRLGAGCESAEAPE